MFIRLKLPVLGLYRLPSLARSVLPSTTTFLLLFNKAIILPSSDQVALTGSCSEVFSNSFAFCRVKFSLITIAVFFSFLRALMTSCFVNQETNLQITGLFASLLNLRCSTATYHLLILSLPVLFLLLIRSGICLGDHKFERCFFLVYCSISFILLD